MIDRAVKGLKSFECARRAGMTTNVFRSQMTRMRATGEDFQLPVEDWIDLRSPLYDEAKINAWVADRQRGMEKK